MTGVQTCALPILLCLALPCLALPCLVRAFSCFTCCEGDIGVRLVGVGRVTRDRESDQYFYNTFSALQNSKTSNIT